MHDQQNVKFRCRMKGRTDRQLRSQPHYGNFSLRTCRKCVPKTE